MLKKCYDNVKCVLDNKDVSVCSQPEDFINHKFHSTV